MRAIEERWKKAVDTKLLSFNFLYMTLSSINRRGPEKTGTTQVTNAIDYYQRAGDNNPYPGVDSLGMGYSLVHGNPAGIVVLTIYIYSKCFILLATIYNVHNCLLISWLPQ